MTSTGASGTKQKHPRPGTHLWDEAAARHRVEAELAHILGTGTLSPLACQQKVLLGFLLNVRPQQSIRMGLGCTARTWVAEVILHMVAIGPHMDQQGHAYLKHTGQQRGHELILLAYHQNAYLTISFFTLQSTGRWCATQPITEISPLSTNPG